MRILLVADPMLPVPPKHYGGIERIIDMLCRSYTERGHEVLLLAHPDSETPVSLVPLPGLNTRSKWDTAKNAGTIARQVARFRPHIVHSFGRLVQLLPLMRSTQPKIMSYQREPSLQGIRRAASLSKDRSMVFTGCSRYISDQISPFAECSTIYNGVAPDRFRFRSKVEPDAPLVFLGRLERIKGVHNAIRIAKESGRRLVIAGNIPDGPEHAHYFSSEIQPHLCDMIQYVGAVDDTQKNELLGGALAMIMAIEWNEPFGIVMAEALACGTPVLGTPLGAVPEVVIDNKSGFVRSVEELGDMVQQVPLLDRKDCRESCEERFSDSVVASNYVRLYQQLLDRDTRRQ